jgi:hypothetical protein
MALNPQQITLQVAEKLREIATRQGNVPFDKGDLRKAHVVEPSGANDALLSANTPYARRVHDGSGEITIKPKKAKALRFKGKDGTAFAKKVVQPARIGRPWLRDAVEELEREGLGFMADQIGQELADELTANLRARGFDARRA